MYVYEEMYYFSREERFWQFFSVEYINKEDIILRLHTLTNFLMVISFRMEPSTTMYPRYLRIVSEFA